MTPDTPLPSITSSSAGGGQTRTPQWLSNPWCMQHEHFFIFSQEPIHNIGLSNLTCFTSIFSLGILLRMNCPSCVWRLLRGWPAVLHFGALYGLGVALRGPLRACPPGPRNTGHTLPHNIMSCHEVRLKPEQPACGRLQKQQNKNLVMNTSQLFDYSATIV